MSLPWVIGLSFIEDADMRECRFLSASGKQVVY